MPFGILCIRSDQQFGKKLAQAQSSLHRPNFEILEIRNLEISKLEERLE